MRKCIHIFKWTEQFVSSFTFYIGGRKASKDNTLLIKQALSYWASIPLELADVRINLDRYQSQLAYCLLAISKYDFNIFLDDFEKCYQHLISSLRDDLKVKDFKGLVTFPQILLPINPAITSWISTGNTEHLRLACTYFRFLRKLPFENPALQESALVSFLETEDRLASLCLLDNPYIPELRNIIVRWLEDMDLSFVPVRHGGGSVAEGSLTKVQKYLGLSSDSLLEQFLSWKLPFDPQLYFPFGKGCDLQRYSRVKFVPKTATKLRTICMEPVTLQYFQQGVMRVTYDYISHHKFLSKKIVLKDQSQNQRFAKRGSQNNDYSTIDLSAASDSVSWDLFKLLFRGTEFGTWATATRSTGHILPNGDRIKSYKFAPMGSALCFPTECIIFCAVVELVARRREGTAFGKESYTDYTVFGDDLVIPKLWTDDVINVLISLGFLVNTEKSFVDGPFRESCGKDYYKGIDISCLYYRFKPLRPKLTPADFISLCSFANNAFEHGLFFLRELVIKTILEKKKGVPAWWPVYPLFTDDTSHSPAIFSPFPTNFSSNTRFNRSLWRQEVQYLSVGSDEFDKDIDLLTDTVNYFEFLVEREFFLTPTLDAYQRSTAPRRPVYKRVCTAL